MTTQALLILAALVAMGADIPNDDESASKDRKALQGTWRAVSAIRSGREWDSFKGTKLTVEGNKFTLKSNDREESIFTRLLATKEKPWQIDYYTKEGKRVSQGIYRLEKDKLTFCFTRGAAERPKKFESKEGNRARLIVFQREKKKDNDSR